MIGFGADGRLVMFSLNGKRVLVTGSSQGIGMEIAKVLADNGAYVFVHGSKNWDKANAIANIIKEKGGLAQATISDLSEKNGAINLYNQTGNIDILIINASVQIRKDWDEITEDEFDTQVQVNLKASLKLIQLYVPFMKEKHWGRIITIGSIQQYVPHKQMLVYAATKSAQMSMVLNLAKQLAPFGITVNNVAPGTIETPRNENVIQDPIYLKQILDGIPLGVVGQPKDCAPGVLLLCSEGGRYITGIDLLIDGGMHLK